MLNASRFGLMDLSVMKGKNLFVQHHYDTSKVYLCQYIVLCKDIVDTS